MLAGWRLANSQNARNKFTVLQIRDHKATNEEAIIVRVLIVSGAGKTFSLFLIWSFPKTVAQKRENFLLS